MPDPIGSLRLTCRKLSLTDYRVDMHIGALDCERTGTQPVVFCVDVWVPVSQTVGLSLEQVYDYSLIGQAIDRVTSASHIDLQETVVDAVAALLLEDSRVQAVRVSSRKPQAYRNASSAGVEIFRCRAS